MCLAEIFTCHILHIQYIYVHMTIKRDLQPRLRDRASYLVTREHIRIVAYNQYPLVSAYMYVLLDSNR
jgi:hypothetical protein